MSDLSKILIITARADFGGGPEHIYRLVQNLKNEFDFYIACPDDYPYKKRFSGLITEDRIIIIPHRKFVISELFKLKKYAKQKHVSLIHSHGKGAGIYGRLLSLITSVPCIHTFHGIHIGQYSRLKKSIYIFIEKLLSLFTKKFISVSKSEYDKVLNLGISGASKITVIENAVMLPKDIIADRNFSKDKKIITTITRFDFAKNSSLLIPVFEKLKSITNIESYEMVVLGSGEDEERIRQKSFSLSFGKTFSFKGMVESPADYLINSFCYISTSRWEAMPLGVMEAMSFGIPVIATKVVGNKDLVEHNVTGFLFDINKPGQAAEYINLLSEDFSLWKKMSLAARKKIEGNFSLDKMADKTKNVYNEVIQSS